MPEQYLSRARSLYWRMRCSLLLICLLPHCRCIESTGQRVHGGFRCVNRSPLTVVMPRSFTQPLFNWTMVTSGRCSGRAIQSLLSNWHVERQIPFGVPMNNRP